MKLGPSDNCRYCKEQIMICQIRGGKWLPFDMTMVAATLDAPDAYLPVRTAENVIGLMPVEEVAPRLLEGVRWLAQRHRCSAFFLSVSAKRRAREAQREAVDSLAEALATHFGLTTEETP